MNKKMILTTALTCSLLLAGCGSQEVASPPVVLKPVTVETAQMQTGIEETLYFGTIQAESTKKMSFRSGGRIESVVVEVGQVVAPGDVIATLDTGDLEAQHNATLDQIRAAQQDVVKVKEQLSHLKDQEAKLVSLHAAGAASQDQVDSIQTNVATTEASFLQASLQVERLHYQRQTHEDLLKDGVLVSDMEGVVTDVLGEPGELLGVGSPVALVRSMDETIRFTVPQKDVKKVHVDQNVRVPVEEGYINGTVTKVKDSPDPLTRGYEILATIPSGQLPIGTPVEVYVPTGVQTGIWVPITAILSTSTDYVLIHEEGIAVRKNIEIDQLRGDLAMISGIEAGDQVIVSGMGNLRAGKGVQVLSKDGEQQ